MIAELNGLTWLCCECKKRLSESEMFQYGGTLACEGCVRSYYEKQNSVGDPDIQWDVARELAERRRNAIEWVRRNRRELEKYAAKFGY